MTQLSRFKDLKIDFMVGVITNFKFVDMHSILMETFQVSTEVEFEISPFCRSEVRLHTCTRKNTLYTLIF